MHKTALVYGVIITCCNIIAFFFQVENPKTDYANNYTIATLLQLVVLFLTYSWRKFAILIQPISAIQFVAVLLASEVTLKKFTDIRIYLWMAQIVIICPLHVNITFSAV